MRKKIVAGNWKMNTQLKEGELLAKELVDKYNHKDVDLIIAPPYTHLDSISKITQNSLVKLSAQNVSKENFGAYTGEIAAEVIKEIGANYSIIGHSERRAYYLESDEVLLAKTKKALSVGLKPIFCVGENLQERESEKYFERIQQQLSKGIFGIESEDFQNIIIAYEPVWAIGTGVTATPKQAQEIHAFIRRTVAEHYSQEIADNLSILYGGSCKPSNAKELFLQEDIDGGLIGGAALNADDFIAIAESF